MGTNNERLLSIDALRGFDMFWIIGWGSIWHSLAELTGSPFLNWWSFQMTHAEWEGFRFYDFIFPLFLFIAGISFPFSLDKSRQKGIAQKSLYFKIIKRALILVLLGFVFNGFLKLEFGWFRYTSVLGRIGLAWMFAAIIFINVKLRGRIIWCAGLLIFYWLINALIPAPDFPDAPRFSEEGSITCYVDRVLNTTQSLSNAVGILGLIPSIATALLGMLTGAFIKTSKEGLTQNKKVLYMTGAGVALIALGLLWGLAFPINKPLWSSSYVCLAGGMSLLFFALFYWIIDVRGYRRWTFFFTVIGMNSITIYMAQQMINFRFTANYFLGGLIKHFPDDWAPFLNNFTLIVVCWLFLYFLYKQKIFIKV
jgi:predicted acyltransferase